MFERKTTDSSGKTSELLFVLEALKAHEGEIDKSVTKLDEIAKDLFDSLQRLKSATKRMDEKLSSLENDIKKI